MRIAPFVTGFALLLIAAAPARPPAAPRRAAIPPPPQPEAGQLIDGPDSPLYVEVLGSGGEVPLVVLHGGPGYSHAYFHCSPAWDSLARRRRVVFYDQRGVGRSGRLRVGQALTTESQIADLEAVRRHLGAERLDLLGHSYGGYLAMAYAERQAGHLAHLVLCDSSDPNWNSTQNVLYQMYPERASAVLDSLAAATSDSAAIRRAFGAYMAMAFFSPEKRDAFLSHPEWLEVHPDINGRLRAAMSEENLRIAVLQFRIPTLVLSGRYDLVAVPGVAYDIHGSIPGSRLHVFERSGHLPFYEEPVEFARVVGEFLSGR